MTCTLLGPDDYRAMPWKNGGGTTCELYRLAHPERPDDFALRLSIAQVAQGGPFSSFPGVDRQLMLLAGAGMRLQFDDGRTALLDTPLAPIAFQGEQAVACTLLDGALQDFNLMVARDWGRAKLTIEHLQAGQSVRLDHPDLQLCHLRQGELQGDDLLMRAGQTLVLRASEQTLSARQPSVLIRIEASPATAL
ncbi:HutD/Ves family protein [Chitinimonas naiadis]